MSKGFLLRILMALAILAGVTAGCGSGKGLSATAEWNFLVYMDGDNNLEADGIADLTEMETIGSTDKVNVLVLFDRIPGYDSSHGDWAETRLFRVRKNETGSAEFASEWIPGYNSDQPELDMSDPDTLRDFIVYCQQNYPAKHTVLTLWNHGGGVYPRSVAGRGAVAAIRSMQSSSRDVINKGICWDDTTGTGSWNCLTTDEVSQAFAAARAATGQKLDVINMDACLTMMLEIAYEWRNDADFLVGSEETVPGTGNDYHRVLGRLTADPSVTPQVLSQSLVEEYYAYYQSGSDYTTYSALDLGTPLTGVMTAFKPFAAALYDSDDRTGIVQAWEETDGYDYTENKDLRDFIDKLGAASTDTRLKTAAGTLKTALDNAIIAHCETGIHAGKSHGLAILIPDKDTWVYYSQSNQYVMLALSGDTLWNEFILKLLNWTAPTV